MAGFLARTLGGLLRPRTFQVGNANISITNPTGDAGDPTFSLAANVSVDNIVIANVGSTSTVGIIYRAVLAAANRFLHTFDPGGSATGNNLYLGFGAGNFTAAFIDSNSNASNNVGIGSAALAAQTGGGNNTMVGFNTGKAITTGYKNTGVGALCFNSLTTGTTNMALGYAALRDGTTGCIDNVAMGFETLLVNNSNSNVAVGARAARSNTGANNVAIGTQALQRNTGGSNVAIGSDAMNPSSSTAGNCVAVGLQALVALTGGSGHNVAIGKSAGAVATTDDNLTLLGDAADRSGGSAITDSIAIGSGTKVGASHTAVIGTSTITETDLFGAVTLDRTGLAVTPTDGYIAKNTTAATGGATVQMSPRIRLRGNAWDTAASQTLDWTMENLPATAATPTSTFRFRHSLNAAAYADKLLLASSGQLTVYGDVLPNADNTLNLGSASFQYQRLYTTQIKFPGTDVTSADPNTLYDYEVGTWTPQLYFNFNNTGMTYGLQSGTYVKIGSLVVLQGRFDLTAKGSSTGTALMNPLPFLEMDSLANGFACTFFSAFAAGVNTMPTAYVTTGFTANLAYSVATGISLLQDTDFTNTSALIWTHVYRTSE